MRILVLEDDMDQRGDVPLRLRQEFPAATVISLPGKASVDGMLIKGEAPDQKSPVEESFLVRLLDGIPVAILYLDSQLIFRYVNREAVIMLGRPEEQILGRHLHQVAIRQAELWRLIEDTVATGQPGERRPVCWSDRGGANGRVFSTSCLPGLDDNGQVTGVFVVGHDITEHVEASHACERTRTMLECVLRQVPVGVVIAEAPSGRLISLNEQVAQIHRKLPVDYHEATLGCLDPGFHSDGRPYDLEEWPLTRALRSGEVVRAEEINLVRGDNTHGLVRASAAPVRDEQGQVIAAVEILEDLSEWQQAEEARDRFVAMLEQLRGGLERLIQERTADLVRTQEALRQSAYQLELLYGIDQAILAARSPAEIAQATVEQLSVAMPVCGIITVALFDFDARQGTLLAVAGGRANLYPAHTNIAVESFTVPVGYWRGEPYLIEDLAATASQSPLKQDLLAKGLRAHLSVPLLTEGKLIGVLHFAANEPGVIDEEMAATALPVAMSLAVALQNARLFEQVRVDREQLQKLTHRLVEVQEGERRAIARELHDQAGQCLSTLMIGLGLLSKELERDCQAPASVFDRLAELENLANDVLEDLHGLAVNLRPPSLDRLGLLPALRQYVDMIRRQTTLQIDLVTFNWGTTSADRLPPDVETSLYRIVQEAVTNVVRHAGAHQVGIILERRTVPPRNGDGPEPVPPHIITIIEDDGVGFDAEEALLRSRMGLIGMRERAEMLGGTLTVESTPGSGTTIFIDVPL